MMPLNKGGFSRHSSMRFRAKASCLVQNGFLVRNRRLLDICRTGNHCLPISVPAAMTVLPLAPLPAYLCTYLKLVRAGKKGILNRLRQQLLVGYRPR